MKFRLKMSKSQWNHLRSIVFTEDGHENAAFLLCGTAALPKGADLLVRRVVGVPRLSYIQRLPYHLEINSDFINSVVNDALKEGLSIIIVHSHPSSSAASFSLSDDAGEERLMPVLAQLVPGLHGSLLLSPDHWAGRVWTEDGTTDLEGLSVVGPNVQVWNGTEVSPDFDEVFDRQRRFWGVASQTQLQHLKVGVVGVGGTGSSVAEQLRRLGVGDFVLVDNDIIEPSNLSRMYGTTTDSVGRSKVTVVSERLRDLLMPPAMILSIEDNVIRSKVLTKLRDRDVIFSCTDTLLSRAVLNRFAYQYLIPVIDMGVRVDIRSGRLQGASGRVSLVGPDMTCLRCSGHLDPDLLREELTPKQEYGRLKEEGYIRGSDDPEPQVISLNSTVSSLSVTSMLAQMTGLYQPILEQAYDALTSTMFGVRAKHQDVCDICGKLGLIGLGDTIAVSPIGE